MKKAGNPYTLFSVNEQIRDEIIPIHLNIKHERKYLTFLKTNVMRLNIF
jgi:hypothetical protein